MLNMIFVKFFADDIDEFDDNKIAIKLRGL